MRATLLGASLLLFLAGVCPSAGCGDGQPLSDGGPGLDVRSTEADGLRRPDAEVPFSLPPGGDGHSQVGAALAAGQARAGRTTSQDQLLRGLKSTSRVGDFKIYNDRVAFIIADTRTPSGFAPYGGKLLDAARTAPESESLLGEIIFGVGIHLLAPTSVGVINDGSDGKPALVRVIGAPAPFPLLASALGKLDPQPVRLVIDYELAPDSEALEVRWRFFNRAHVAQELPFLPLGVTAGDGLQLFSEEAGFDVDNAQAQDYVAMISPGIAYALHSLEAPLQPLLSREGILCFSSGGVQLASAAEAQRRYRLLVTDGEPEAVRRALRAKRGAPEPPPLAGVVRSGQAAVAGVRVHVERDEVARRYVTMTRTDASGAFRVGLEAGSYRLTAVADGRTVPAAVPVKVGGATASVDLEVPPRARLNCSVTDSKGSIPAKLTIKPEQPPTASPASFGEAGWPGGSLIRFSASGKETVDLPAGSYTVTASRGFEYEIQQSQVTLAADEEKSLAFALTRSVSTPGAMCGDFHVHAMWSPDSNDLYELKVAALAAEGLEIPVITEHEWIADLNPTIAKLGLQPWLRGVVGEELTTFVYGHFNPFPITPDPAKPNQGAVTWFEKRPGTVFAEVRATWPGAVLQVNHPRSRMGGGYLDYLGYNADTGKATRDSEWSRLFDVLEVFNGSGWNANASSTVKDWYSFLDRGFLVTATGNSDSHHAVRDQVGYPRNFVQLSTDEPANLDPIELARAVRENRVLVSGGPFITASVGGKSLGEVANATSKKVNVAVTVQAPTWMPVDKLRLVVSGQTVLEQTLDAATRSPGNPVVRFQGELPVMVDRDSWLIVVVTGSGTLDPVCPGRQPFAVTNPVYLDVDGNGVYDAPTHF